MHEFSIVQTLLDSCDQQAKENKATKITKIVVKIGILSGVEEHLLRSAFDTFKEKTICEEANLDIVIQKVLVKCNDCDKQSTLESYEFTCPECSSTNLDVLDGEDMYLMSLEME